MDNKTLNDVLFSLPKSKKEEEVSAEDVGTTESTVQFDKPVDTEPMTPVSPETSYQQEEVHQTPEALSEDVSEEEDEVTEEEYQQYLADKKKRAKKIKAKNRHKRTFSHILAGALLSVFIVSVSAFLAVYIVKSALDFTGIGKTYCQAQIYISEDSTIDDISKDLASLGIITMPDVFTMYTKMSDAENDFIKGTFTVDTTMSYSALLMNLQTVTTINQTVTVQITEGMTIYEIAEIFEENLVCRAEDFLAQCKDLEKTYKFQKRLEDEPLKFYQMEGYIFPDTYEFYIIPQLEDNSEIDTTEYAKEALDAIYQNFNNKLTARYYSRMNELNMTLDEVITLASVVQREADSIENMGYVASAFMNRLNNPDVFPRLESDVTTLYVTERIKPNMPASEYSKNQAMFDAYDTYTCNGIPVGAICNPGLDAIKAVLYAPDTNYYYFCAHPETMEMFFAETISEHEENLRICGLDDAIAD